MDILIHYEADPLLTINQSPTTNSQGNPHIRQDIQSTTYTLIGELRIILVVKLPLIVSLRYFQCHIYAESRKFRILGNLLQ